MPAAFATAAASARATDFIPAANKGDVIAAYGAGRQRRDGGSDVQGAGRGGQLSVPLHLPRPLRGRHEGQSGRQVVVRNWPSRNLPRRPGHHVNPLRKMQHGRLASMRDASRRRHRLHLNLRFRALQRPRPVMDVHPDRRAAARRVEAIALGRGSSRASPVSPGRVIPPASSARRTAPAARRSRRCGGSRR